VAFSGDQLPDLKLIPDTGSQLYDLSGELMPHNYRRSDPALCPLIPLRDVHVGTAHSSMVNTYEYIVGAARRFRNIGYRQSWFGTGFDYGSH
jgi:hypothetical protein